MEITITDNRVRSSRWAVERKALERSNSINFDNNKIYFDTGFCLNISLKVIIESASIAKLSKKTYDKKMSKDIVKCIDERNKKTIVSGIIIRLETIFEDLFRTYINLDSGYLIYLNYGEEDLRDILEVVKNEEKS